MGDLALHVAKAARRRHPSKVLPDDVAPYFAEMGRVALDLAQDARQVILTRDIELAFTMESDDDAMDDLHRHLFTVLLSKDWPNGGGAGHRRHAPGPVLRALRRPRRRGGPSRRLHGHGQDAQLAGGLGTQALEQPRRDLLTGPDAGGGRDGDVVGVPAEVVQLAVRGPHGRVGVEQQVGVEERVTGREHRSARGAGARSPRRRRSW